MSAAKLDLKKTLKHLYNPSAENPALVDVPPFGCLMVDGTGDPNTAPAYQAALEALYAVAYALKFASKAAGNDYAVMPLEGLWWAEDMSSFSPENYHSHKDQWLWTMFIVQPDHITADMVDDAITQVRAKKNPAALDLVRFETYHEGLAAQIMHIGPYSAEGPTVARLHAWLAGQGYTQVGAKHHHEIYLSDPRRTAPDKMKTVIRQPVIPVANS